MDILGFLLHWTVRLAPGLVMTSLLFALDGGLRWLGLMGPVLLVLAFAGGGCACSLVRHGSDNRPRAFPGI